MNKVKKYFVFKSAVSLVLLVLLPFFVALIVPNSSFAQAGDSSHVKKTGFNKQVLPSACDCEQKIMTPKPGTNFSTLLETRIKYPELERATGWALVDKDNAFKGLTFSDVRNQVSPSLDSGYSLSIKSFISPIKLIHPDNTFAINLTPCTNDQHVFVLPVFVRRSFELLNYAPEFNYKKFDHTAKSYLHMMRVRLNIKPEDILKSRILDMTKYGDATLTELNQFVLKINKKYGTVIPDTGLNKLNNKNIDSIVSQIKSKIIGLNKSEEEIDAPSLANQGKFKNTDLEAFITNEFIVNTNKPHVINKEEKQRLLYVLFEFYRNPDFSNIDKYILQPQYNASIDVKKIGVEINDNVIRSWDNANKQPLLDLNKKVVESKIVLDIPGVEFDSRIGLHTEIKNTCFSTSEITGTGIVFDVDSAILVDNVHNRNFSMYDYPLFKIKPIPGENIEVADGMNITRYDSLITNFTGLLITETKIRIPFKNDTIYGSVKNLIINNKMIAGTINIPVKQLKDDQQVNFSIEQGGKIITTDILELEKDFYKKGLIELLFDKKDAVLTIDFKKIFPENTN